MEPVKKPTLFELTAQMSAIDAALEESGGELTPEVEDLLNETGDSLRAKVDSYNALLRLWDGKAKMIADEIKRLQGMKKTLENSIDRVREHVLDVMKHNEIQRIDGNFCKMYLTDRVAMDVNEDALLANYRPLFDKLAKELPVWLTVEPKISKKSLQDTCRPAGVTIENLPDGVAFESRKSLNIK